MTSLDEFATGEPDHRAGRWSDELPDEIVKEILESKAGAATINRWLLAEGFEGSTVPRLRALIEERQRG